MWNILCFLEDLSLFFLSWFNIFPFSPPPHHSLAIHYAVANILWREEGNTIQFSKVHLYSCEYENMGDISSGPAAGYLHSAGCLPYCPAESQSCFLSSKMFLQILLSSLQLQDVLIPLLVGFLICFFWIIWGENIHIHKEELSAFCKIKRRPSTVAARKTTLWFSAVYKSIPSLYYVFFSTSAWPQVQFHYCIGKPTESNENAVCFLYIIPTSG